MLKFSTDIKKDSWFFEDKVKETLAVHRAFPQLNIVLKESARISIIEYEQSGLSHFKSLTNIKQYVKQQLK